MKLSKKRGREMEIKPLKKKLQLYGFNNLTKSLSFNLYDICYTRTPQQRKEYLQYIDEEYSGTRLTRILTEVAEMIGAYVLNIAQQDYEPQGASVTILIAEDEVDTQTIVYNTDGTVSAETILAHLDKSHITVHTYPESHPDDGISTFRADIDVSTCGRISPLKALNYLLRSFNADMVTLDYRVRGFTRDVNGQKYFIDHKINSIQNYIAPEIKDNYQMIDVNVYQENIFHTKMLLKDFEIDNYLFGMTKKDLLPGEKKQIKQRVKKEMLEIFYGRNISKS
jgi:S-adenosylmethionine decarboxylase